METSLDVATLRFLAFRYALGRSTYIVHDVVQDLIANWDDMNKWHLKIHSEIREAIAVDCAGMTMDVRQWQQVLRLEPQNNNL